MGTADCGYSLDQKTDQKWILHGFETKLFGDQFKTLVSHGDNYRKYGVEHQQLKYDTKIFMSPTFKNVLQLHLANIDGTKIEHFTIIKVLYAFIITYY